MLAAVKKQLDHKKAECESLTYMIKSNVEQPACVENSAAKQESQPENPAKKTMLDYVKSPTDDQQDVRLPDQLPIFD